MSPALKILLVDDEPDLLEFYAFIIENLGYQTASASGGREALEKFKSEAFSLVITDIRMPDGNGLDLIKNIREFNQTTPIFCITGFSELSGEQIIALGANAVFEKPLEHEKLLKLVKDTVACG